MNFLQSLLDALRAAVTWWVMVAPWEQAIRVRFGKNVTLLAPGVHLKYPVIDRVYSQTTRLRVSMMHSQTLTTSDGKPVTIAVNLGYKIADLLKVYNTLHSAESSLAAITVGAVGEYIVNSLAVDCTPAALMFFVQEKVNARLEEFGFSDVEISVQTFAFVKTYRFITGDGHAWSQGDILDTVNEVGRSDYF